MSKMSSKLVSSVRQAKETKPDETRENETEVSNSTSLASSAQSDQKSSPPSKPAPKKKILNDEVPRPKLPSNRVWPD
jgi:hypothetical protein